MALIAFARMMPSPARLSLSMSLFVVLAGCSGTSAETTTATPEPKLGAERSAVASSAPSAAPSAPVTPPTTGVWSTETLGGVGLGAAADDVEKILGKAETSSAPIEEAASGDWATTWSYPSKKIAVGLAGAKKEGPLHVRQVFTLPGSTLKTGAGIGAGSTEAEVEKAYGKDIDRAASTGEMIVVGPERYDAMKLRMEKGVVVTVSIGADGE